MANNRTPLPGQTGNDLALMIAIDGLQEQMRSGFEVVNSRLTHIEQHQLEAARKSGDASSRIRRLEEVLASDETKLMPSESSPGTSAIIAKKGFVAWLGRHAALIIISAIASTVGMAVFTAFISIMNNYLQQQQQAGGP